MRTTYRIKQPYADIFLQCSHDFKCNSKVKPNRFIKKMKRNTGLTTSFWNEYDEEGMEYRNPIITVLGDSVTAGHFESLVTPKIANIMKEVFRLKKEGALKEEIQKKTGFNLSLTPWEIYDARESYVEKFRLKLIDKYELTSLSVINAGIAGDTLPSMVKRAYRDVICHRPDLILINGSLNWDDEEFGDESVYKNILKELVCLFKKETEADIILLTPNGDLPGTIFETGDEIDSFKEPTTPERCAAIREVANEEGVCLADVRAVWDEAAQRGCPWKELLANGVNHPSVEGHEVYAEVLMKLFD